MEITPATRDAVIANLRGALDELAAEPGDQLINWLPGEHNASYYLATDTDAPFSLAGDRKRAVGEASTQHVAEGVFNLFARDHDSLGDVVGRFSGVQDTDRLRAAISRAFVEAGVRPGARGEFDVIVVG